MAYYKGVLDDLIEGGHRTQARDVAARLLSRRHKLSKALPPRNVISCLLMATWNIREFGRRQQVRQSVSTNRSYIAEIISHFNLVAIQEVNQNLDNLQRLVRLLGGWWDTSSPTRRSAGLATASAWPTYKTGGRCASIISRASLALPRGFSTATPESDALVLIKRALGHEPQGSICQRPAIFPAREGEGAVTVYSGSLTPCLPSTSPETSKGCDGPST